MAPWGTASRWPGWRFTARLRMRVTFPGKAATKEQLFDAVITYLSKLSASDRDTQRVLRKFERAQSE